MGGIRDDFSIFGLARRTELLSTGGTELYVYKWEREILSVRRLRKQLNMHVSWQYNFGSYQQEVVFRARRLDEIPQDFVIDRNGQKKDLSLGVL